MSEYLMKIIEMPFFMQEMDVRCGIKDLRVQEIQLTRMETLAFEEGPTQTGEGQARSKCRRTISNRHTKLTLTECLCVTHCAVHSLHFPDEVHSGSWFLSVHLLLPFWPGDSSFCVYPLQTLESLVCWPFSHSPNSHVPSLC